MTQFLINGLSSMVDEREEVIFGILLVISSIALFGGLATYTEWATSQVLLYGSLLTAKVRKDSHANR